MKKIFIYIISAVLFSVISCSNPIQEIDFNNPNDPAVAAVPSFITTWGVNGAGDGEFNHPYGVAVDTSGNVFVADTNNSRIQKFDSSGTFITEWGSKGAGSGQFNYPYHMAIDSSDNIYVTEVNNNRIQKFHF